MEAIRPLATTIEDRWRKHNYDSVAFPEIAVTAFKEFKPADNIDFRDIVKWAVNGPSFTHQRNIDSKFGEPEVTLYEGRRFVIEAIFWLDGTTEIHQHAFSGAFYVLEGSSIHSEYAFEPSRRVNAHMQLGTIEFRRTALLTRGSVHPIIGGNRLIHSLFHLDRPSVTLVARTYQDPDKTPQFSYLKPGVARDSSFREQRLQRELQMLYVLQRSGDRQYLPLMSDVIRRADLHSCLLVLESAFYNNPNDRDEFAALLAVAEAAHGEPVALFRALFEERRRQIFIMARRAVVTAPDHRYLLALLLNLPNRAAILDMVRARCPDADPKETIVRWVEELSQGETSPNPLGFEFGTAELAVFRAVLDGGTNEECVKRIEQAYDGISDNRAEYVALAEAIRNSPLFKPLFTN